MLRVNNVDLSPQKLLQYSASPQGPLPPSTSPQGSAQLETAVGYNLITQTMNQVNTAQATGVGGRVDLLG